MSTLTEEKMVISEIENWHHYCVSFFINREIEMNDMLMELQHVHKNLPSGCFCHKIKEKGHPSSPP